MVLGSKQLLGRGLSASLFQGLRQGLVPFLSQPTACSSLTVCDLLQNTNIGGWYARMFTTVGPSSRVA